MEHYSKNLLNKKKGIADLKLAIPRLAMSTNLCQAIKKMLHEAVDKNSTDLRKKKLENPNRKKKPFLLEVAGKKYHIQKESWNQKVEDKLKR